MAGRPRHYEEKELIAKAMTVFAQKGYKASTLSELMKAMDIGQGSFYLNFKGGKEELYRKTLMYRWETIRDQLRDGVQKGLDPIAIVKSIFYDMLKRSDQEIMNGCYIGNAIVEFRDLDKGTRDLAIDILAKFEEEIQKILRIAQKQGKLDKEKNTAEIAKCLINLWNGTNISQRAYSDNKFIDNVIEMNFKMLFG